MGGCAVVSRYLRFLNRAGTDLDVLSAAGVGLGVFALAFFVSAVAPAKEEIGRLRAELTRVRSAAVSTPHDGEAAARSSSQLATFTRNFPTLSEAPAWILRMHQIARHNDLTLATGEYRLTAARDGGLARYQITLPLHGGYAQVRAFLEQVLTEIPAAALDEVAIKRDSVDARATETRVRLTLYLAGGQ
ncbi:MAG: rane protein [Betaproteobacteria bacterium]|nr:rane protein [Betaproteobacteria bacterium]